MSRSSSSGCTDPGTRPVWLVDLDLLGPGQQAAISAQASRYGVLGRPAIASPDG